MCMMMCSSYARPCCRDLHFNSTAHASLFSTVLLAFLSTRQKLYTLPVSGPDYFVRRAPRGTVPTCCGVDELAFRCSYDTNVYTAPRRIAPATRTIIVFLMRLRVPIDAPPAPPPTSGVSSCLGALKSLPLGEEDGL